jgi:hypothetical protein
MLRRSVVIALTATLLEATVGRLRLGAAQILAPLRKLVYHVELHLLASDEQAIARPTGRRGATTPATVHVQQNVDDDGTLTVDVVAATADGGLVVDSSFAGRETQQPTIRVAIYADGRLAFDPRSQLSRQSSRVLPLLARGLVANRDVSPGVSWTTATPKPTTGTMTYHVEHVDGDRATLGIEDDTILAGPSGFSEHGHGTTIYATDRLCPLRYDLELVVRRSQRRGRERTENEHLVATLLSDTFATPASR